MRTLNIQDKQQISRKTHRMIEHQQPLKPILENSLE